jgi:hypothetical protein
MSRPNSKGVMTGSAEEGAGPIEWEIPCSKAGSQCRSHELGAGVSVRAEVSVVAGQPGAQGAQL